MPSLGSSRAVGAAQGLAFEAHADAVAAAGDRPRGAGERGGVGDPVGAGAEDGAQRDRRAGGRGDGGEVQQPRELAARGRRPARRRAASGAGPRPERVSVATEPRTSLDVQAAANGEVGAQAGGGWAEGEGLAGAQGEDAVVADRGAVDVGRGGGARERHGAQPVRAHRQTAEEDLDGGGVLVVVGDEAVGQAQRRAVGRARAGHARPPRGRGGRGPARARAGRRARPPARAGGPTASPAAAAARFAIAAGGRPGRAGARPCVWVAAGAPSCDGARALSGVVLATKRTCAPGVKQRGRGACRRPTARRPSDRSAASRPASCGGRPR